MNLPKSKMTKGGGFTFYRGRKNKTENQQTNTTTENDKGKKKHHHQPTKQTHINLVGYANSRAIALIPQQPFRSALEGLFRKAIVKLL